MVGFIKVIAGGCGGLTELLQEGRSEQKMKPVTTRKPVSGMGDYMLSSI